MIRSILLIIGGGAISYPLIYWLDHPSAPSQYLRARRAKRNAERVRDTESLRIFRSMNSTKALDKAVVYGPASTGVDNADQSA